MNEFFTNLIDTLTQSQLLIPCIVLIALLLIVPTVVVIYRKVKKAEPAQLPVAEPVVEPAAEPIPPETVDAAVEEAIDEVAEETTMEEKTMEVAEQTVSVEEETESFRGIEEGTGLAIIARYKKSFLAKMTQAPEEAKGYYSTLKNAILSYRKVTSRISWGYDSINAGRTKLAKFTMRGKTLGLYLALDPDALANTKYKVTRVESAKYADVPCLYKVTSDRKLKYALELLAMLAEKMELVAGAPSEEDFYLPYESTEELVAKGLIKELITKENYETFLHRKSLETIAHEHRDVVSAAEVDAIITDEVAMEAVEDHHAEQTGTSAGKKAIVNVDVLARNFAAGETVTLKALKEKGLVAKNVTFVKVLARGIVDKPLNVKLHAYSTQAVKMLVLTGGHVEII